jgi:hypothetical protein
MASNVSTVDGMGFEEVNQASFTETISGSNIYGTTGSFTNIRITNLVGVTSISGTNIYGTTISGTNFRAGGSITDTLGRHFPVAIENDTQLFGYRVVAGSVLIGNSSSGLIAFPSAGSFSTANYFMTISARDWSLPVASNTSGTGFSISGLRRASGCWAYGPSGTVADWIAVGI